MLLILAQFECSFRSGNAYPLQLYEFLRFIYLFERDRGSMSGEGTRRRRLPSRLHTVSVEPDKGLSLINHEMVT